MLNQNIVQITESNCRTDCRTNSKSTIYSDILSIKTLDTVVFKNYSDLFKIAGPVIVVGVALSMLVGTVYWILLLLGILV